MPRLFLVLILVSATAGASAVPQATTLQPGELPSAAPGDAEVRAKLAGLRVPFIANEGTVDTKVAYYAPTFSGTLFVTRSGELVYSLPNPTVDAPAGRPHLHASRGWSLTERWVGGRARPVASDRSETRVSYFLGSDAARWRPDVPTYAQVSLGEVWPGITVDLRARGGSVEKVFTVAPGASADRIRVRVSGASGLSVDPQGALVARTGLGSVTFTAPIAYQERDGTRRPVSVTYRLKRREYRFAVGAYDPSLPLVIDPLLQSTYQQGLVNTLAIHPTTGDVYVAGLISGNELPSSSGGAQPMSGGSLDAFVARLTRSLTAVTQATFLGGSSLDFARALALSPTTGDVYVAGGTASTNFPNTAGGAQPANGGQSDGFIARFPSSLTTLTQTTYLGGNFSDLVGALAIAPTTGDVYVAGVTGSTNFPATAGGAQPMSGGNDDAFVARLTGSLTGLIQATYLGGNSGDAASALAIAPTTGDVYVAGRTASAFSFPGVTGGAQPAFGGGDSDAFVARFPSSLTTLTQATFLGGSAVDPTFSSPETAYALAIAPSTGDVYVAGTTPSADFPGTTGGAQPAFGGGPADAFVARLSSSLTTLIQATYLGGNGALVGPQLPVEVAHAMAIAPATGNVYVAGLNGSTDFPGTSGGAQTFAGFGFVARLTLSLALVDPTPTTTVAAVLPLSRSVGPATASVLAAPTITTATAFAAIINTGAATALNCAPGPPSSPPAGLGTFTYQTTNAANQLTGTANTAANIASGATQNFVFAISPTAAISETSLALQFVCDNAAAPQYPGVNNFFIVADTSPVPDTIALISTLSGDGVVRIDSASSTQLFGMGTSNVGATGSIVVSADDGGAGLPLTLMVCETNTATGACLVPPTSTVTITYTGGTNRSFAFFAQASGPIAFDPANKRVFPRLKQGGVLRGATSAAVCTKPNAGC